MGTEKIKLNFTGFWPAWDKENNFLSRAISRLGFRIEISAEPDYLFCCNNSTDYLDYDCVRIFYTGENIVPDFNLFDYAIGFDFINFGDRYLRYPLYLTYEQDFQLMKEKHLHADEFIAEKQNFCSMVVSHGKSYAAPARETFFHLLSNYKQVDSGGRFLNTIGVPEGVTDKIAFEKTHKFSIAFENTSHPGYTTEKIVQAFAAGTVPIYWGDPDISNDFNPDSFVNCMAYNSFDDVVQRIREIDQDDNVYSNMLHQPALQNSDFAGNKEKELESFLKNIFEQPKAAAIRRDQFGWGRKYEDQRKYFSVEEELAKIRRRFRR